MALNKIRIQSDGIETKVHVDDEEITQATSLNLTVDTETRIPRLMISMDAGVDIDSLGIAQIVREPTPGEVMRVAAEWLDGVNVETVRAVLEERATTMRQDPVATIIKILADAAREVAD